MHRRRVLVSGVCIRIMRRVHLRRSDSELKNELGIQVLLPGDEDLRHLAKRWYGLRPDEKVVGQINSDRGTGLVNDKRGIVSSYV